MDEINPDGRRSPDEWLCRLDDGVWAVGIKDPGEDLEMWRAKVIKPGDVVLFEACLTTPSFDLTVDEDGGYRPSEAPGGATHFWMNGDSDTVCDSLAMMAEYIRECEDAGTYTVDGMAWSDHRFRFEIGPDGQGRFVEIGEAEHA
ncbi:hypothetical protein [Methylobacterium nodulans]|uniref:Uncharacterized protein n=1 Tax=Methylobacterium nodulans (strain LMG 21967 / CNCM I-2342 / ORS 2060) TaxID=460265 RepID=B8IH11_METNO|nr:hypothetical protein [Methylobacterium nodulans]ACL57886.1 hypothetical protein Mnod_2935 [Methylobacterium nodulans ORS 2060]